MKDYTCLCVISLSTLCLSVTVKMKNKSRVMSNACIKPGHSGKGIYFFYLPFLPLPPSLYFHRPPSIVLCSRTFFYFYAREIEYLFAWYCTTDIHIETNQHIISGGMSKPLCFSSKEPERCMNIIIVLIVHKEKTDNGSNHYLKVLRYVPQCVL